MSIVDRQLLFLFHLQLIYLSFTDFFHSQLVYLATTIKSVETQRKIESMFTICLQNAHDLG